MYFLSQDTCSLYTQPLGKLKSIKALACGLQVKVAQHLRFLTRSQLVGLSLSQTLSRA